MLTKEQRDNLAKALDAPWGPSVYLPCDGRRITLQVQRVGGPGINYRVMTFVDGEFRGIWCKGEAPESKFLRKSETRLISLAKRKLAEKKLGKRWVAKQPIYNKTLTYYYPDWPNGKAAIRHLCKVCESVEIAPSEAL